MTTYRLTHHSQDRIQNRLGGLVSMPEVMSKVQSKNLPSGRSYVEIKRVQYTEVKDENVQPDGIARGDQIVAVVDNDNNPRITTVILRKSWSNSATYSKIYK
jgi:hypothetical protein